jgi:hypothetical protein
MIHEPFFSLPIVPALTILEVAMQAPVVTPPMTTRCEDLEPVCQEPTEPVVEHEKELQQPPLIDVSEVEAHNEPENEALRRSKRVKKSAISTDYKVYNIETIHMEGDPTSYEVAMEIPNSSKWLEAMEDEMKSMSSNNVWGLEEIPKGAKTVGYKWVYKTKYDSNGNVEKYKVRLVAKGFTQREGIDYNGTFSPVSCKDSFRIIMALVAHFDLELHQIDVKMTFLNGDLEERVYMKQPRGFIMEGKKDMGCRLKKSIYGLKQDSRQWYLKFNEIIKRFEFKENVEDNCIYARFKVGNIFS